jgi:hypothetical protein
MAKVNRKTLDVTFTLLGATAAVFLVVIGSLCFYAYNFATSNVRTELTAQKIFFPPAGSPGLTAAEFPTLQHYGGQQVNDGIKAKAYANEFIGAHLKKIANGQTYSEVSTASRNDPTNAKLIGQKAALFQGETLRGLLLGDGYVFWTFGLIAFYAGIAAFIGAGVMAILTLLGAYHVKLSK